jgi:hypothetical protein
MKKIALFVFNGDPMCFIHVLLNALDMKERSSGTSYSPLVKHKIDKSKIIIISNV